MFDVCTTSWAPKPSFGIVGRWMSGAPHNPNSPFFAKFSKYVKKVKNTWICGDRLDDDDIAQFGCEMATWGEWSTGQMKFSRITRHHHHHHNWGIRPRGWSCDMYARRRVSDPSSPDSKYLSAASTRCRLAITKKLRIHISGSCMPHRVKCAARFLLHHESNFSQWSDPLIQRAWIGQLFDVYNDFQPTMWLKDKAEWNASSSI